jgi:hypothetical protein
MVYVPPPILVRTFEPRPSFASTDPLEKLTRGAPDPIARKVIDIIFPLLPVNPAGEPPLKLIVPALLENVGSAIQRLKIELARVTLTTESSRGLKLRVPSAALIDCPPELTFTRTVNVPFELYTPVLGEIDNVAAKATLAEKIKNDATIPAITSPCFRKRIIVLV